MLDLKWMVGKRGGGCYESRSLPLMEWSLVVWLPCVISLSYIISNMSALSGHTPTHTYGRALGCTRTNTHSNVHTHTQKHTPTQTDTHAPTNTHWNWHTHTQGYCSINHASISGGSFTNYNLRKEQNWLSTKHLITSFWPASDKAIHSEISIMAHANCFYELAYAVWSPRSFIVFL